MASEHPMRIETDGFCPWLTVAAGSALHVSDVDLRTGEGATSIFAPMTADEGMAKIDRALERASILADTLAAWQTLRG